MEDSMNHRKLWLYLAIAASVSAFALAGALGASLEGWSFQDQSVHSAMEAAGAIAAILTAVFLLLKEREAAGRNTLFISLGFLAMGLLDGFHAASLPGASFVFLHSMATLAGGAFFALACARRLEVFERHKGILVLTVSAGAIGVGLWAHMSGDSLPSMFTDGNFSTLAKGINLLAGGLFIVAAVRLLRDFYVTGERSLYIFACLSLLLAVAGFTFNYSTLWNSTWWFWHALRLTAFSLVLGWAIEKYRHEYMDTEEDASEKGRHVALGADVGKALIIGKDLREALQGCAEAMVRHLDAAFARIWVLNEKDEVLELYASAGMYTNTDGFHSRLHLRKYPYKIAVIARERKPHLTNNVIGDPMIHDQEWAKKEGMVAFAGYPLVFQDRTVGVVGIFAKKRLSEGALKSLESVADEITVGIERSRSSERLQKSEEMLRGLVEESLSGAYIIQDGKLKYINQAVADIFGYSIEELKNVWLEGVCHAEDYAKEEDINAKLLSGEIPNVRFEARRQRKDGREVILECIRWKTEYEGRPAVIGTALDITERKRLEREKMDFLAMVTHDFKSPLTNILGYSELLLETSRDPAAGEMAEAILRGGRRLSRMVDDFLFHSRLESGIAVIEKEPSDLKGLLKGICEEYALQAQKRGLSFSLELPYNLPEISIDRKLMERAVSNILQNALSYTPQGGKVNVKAEMPGGGIAAITVSDTGPGIPAEMQTKVFDKYFRSPRTAGTRGTGLGLSVVKLVADVHGGNVEVSCPEGRGCTFRILLPVSGEGKKAA
jgi:PAS domain S-box-containing protein